MASNDDFYKLAKEQDERAEADRIDTEKRLEFGEDWISKIFGGGKVKNPGDKKKAWIPNPEYVDTIATTTRVPTTTGGHYKNNKYYDKQGNLKEGWSNIKYNEAGEPQGNQTGVSAVSFRPHDPTILGYKKKKDDRGMWKPSYGYETIYKPSAAEIRNDPSLMRGLNRGLITVEELTGTANEPKFLKKKNGKFKRDNKGRKIRNPNYAPPSKKIWVPEKTTYETVHGTKVNENYKPAGTFNGKKVFRGKNTPEGYVELDESGNGQYIKIEYLDDGAETEYPGLGGLGDKIYDSVVTAYLGEKTGDDWTNKGTGLLGDLYTDRRREDIYDLARRGLLDSSADSMRQTATDDIYSKERKKVVEGADNQRNSVNTAITNAEADAISALHATEDPSSAASGAINAMNDIQDTTADTSFLGDAFNATALGLRSYNNAQNNKNLSSLARPSSPHYSAGMEVG